MRSPVQIPDFLKKPGILAFTHHYQINEEDLCVSEYRNGRFSLARLYYTFALAEDLKITIGSALVAPDFVDKNQVITNPANQMLIARLSLAHCGESSPFKKGVTAWINA